MSSYLTVLRAPHAVRTFGAALIARLSYGVVYLALMLAVVRATGSYTVAGVLLALFGLTSSVLSPLRARIVDRHGPGRALPPMAVVYAAALALIAVATWQTGSSTVLLYVLAVTAGSSTPPVGPVMRALWSDLVPAADLRQRAFSLDTVAEEVMYIGGPLLAGATAAVAHPAAGVALSAILILTGNLLLATSPAVKRSSLVRHGVSAKKRSSPVARLGAVAGISPVVRRMASMLKRLAPGMRRCTGLGTPVRERRGRTVRLQGVAGEYQPVLIAAAVGMCLGALSLLVVAFAQIESRSAMSVVQGGEYPPVDGGGDHLAAVAWIEAALAVGSVIGGLLYGAITWRVAARRRLPLLAAALGSVFAVAGLSMNLYVLAALVTVIGLFVSPVLTTAYLLADENATPETRIQAGAWVNTGFNLTNSAGTALVGLTVAHLPLPWCFVIAAAPPLLAASMTIARSRLSDNDAGPRRTGPGRREGAGRSG